MPLRLVDRNATKVVHLNGGTVTIRQLSGVERMQIGQLAARGDSLDFVRMVPMLQSAIVAPDDFDIDDLADPVDVGRLFTAITEFSTLQDDEAKNSDSSSAPQPETSTGESTSPQQKPQSSKPQGKSHS
jgi:hypothetical protein